MNTPHDDLVLMVQLQKLYDEITEDLRKRQTPPPEVKELEAAIHDFIEQHNADPKPFTWTKSVESILEKVGRARQNIPCPSAV